MLFCLREWVVHAIAQLDNAVLSVDFFNLMFSGSDWTKACVLIQKVVFEWSSLWWSCIAFVVLITMVDFGALRFGFWCQSSVLPVGQSKPLCMALFYVLYSTLSGHSILTALYLYCYCFRLCANSRLTMWRELWFCTRMAAGWGQTRKLTSKGLSCTPMLKLDVVFCVHVHLAT